MLDQYAKYHIDLTYSIIASTALPIPLMFV